MQERKLDARTFTTSSFRLLSEQLHLDQPKRKPIHEGNDNEDIHDPEQGAQYTNSSLLLMRNKAPILEFCGHRNENAIERRVELRHKKMEGVNGVRGRERESDAEFGAGAWSNG